MDPNSGAQDGNAAPPERRGDARSWLRKLGWSRQVTTTALLWSGWAACAIVIVVPTILWAHGTRKAALLAAHDDVSKSAVSAANSIDSLFGLIDVVLKRLSESASEENFGTASTERLCPSLICSNNQRLSPYLILGFVRPNGDVVTYGPDTPRLNVADRDYFIAQKEGDVGLHVGAPRRSPFMVGFALRMSRRLPARAGAFEGIVAAVINIDQVRVVFQGVAAGTADRIGLMNADGRSLVEWRADGGGERGEAEEQTAGTPCELMGANAAVGEMAAAETLRIGDLTVRVCRSEASALRSFYKQVYWVAGVEGLLLAAAALAIPIIGRRRDNRLRQHRGLRGLVAGSSDVQFIIAAKPDGRFVLEALTFTRGGELGRMSARLVGRTTREFFSPEDVDLIEADYSSVLACGQTRRTERRVRLGGDEFTWSTVLVPLCDGSGRGGYIFGAATELTGTGEGELQGGLRRFTEDVLRREDTERRRIARELHDTTGQNLIAAGFELGAVDRGLIDPSPQVRAALSHARSLVNASVSELRTLAYVLHPALLDEAGLGVALQTMAEGFEKRAGVRVVVTVAEELAGQRWLPEIEIALYRVAQEALANVQRHSATKAARVSLLPVTPHHMELVVEDGADGRPVGVPLASPVVEGAGIRGMRDRIEALGGSLTVTPRDGGFRITATVPSEANSS